VHDEVRAQLQRALVDGRGERVVDGDALVAVEIGRASCRERV